MNAVFCEADLVIRILKYINLRQQKEIPTTYDKITIDFL